MSRVILIGMNFVFALIVSCVLYPVPISAGLLDRVVAVVNDKVILLSDLESEIAASEGLKPAEILDRMINRRVLYEEAVKFRMHTIAADEQSVIDLYIERRIRSLIYVRFTESEAYYRNNRAIFGDREFYLVRDEIESILVEKELKSRLKRHVEELRGKAYIRIQLDESEGNS